VGRSLKYEEVYLNAYANGLQRPDRAFRPAWLSFLQRPSARASEPRLNPHARGKFTQEGPCGYVDRSAFADRASAFPRFRAKPSEGRGNASTFAHTQQAPQANKTI